MKVDFNYVIRDLKGEAVLDGKDEFTLKTVACNALLMPYPDEQQLSGTDKYRRFKLADKISSANGEDVDLSAEEVTDLKKLIAKAFSPLVVGRAFDKLDPQ